MDGAASVVAIVGAAATAVKVIKQLKEFVSDVQAVDQTVQGLCNEVESLQTVLELIRNSFPRIEPVVEEEGPIRRVWECVERTGEDCSQAIGKLNQILRRLGKGSTNTYKAVVKQLKFQSESNEIAEIRRQLSFHQMAFQTSLTSIILCIISQEQQPNKNVLDVVFSRLEDRLEELTHHLRSLKATQQDREDTSVASHDSEELIENLEECKESAHAIFDSASSVVMKHSIAGSEAANPLTAAQKDRIFDWAQRTSLSESGTAEPSLEDKSTADFESTIGSDITTPTTAYGGDGADTPANTRIVSPLKLSVRLGLTTRGKAFYSKGLFSDALNCFQDARAMGSVFPSDIDPVSDAMADERLMLWLSLAKVRARRNSRRSKSTDSKLYFGSARLEVARLRSSAATVDDCVNACLLAQIYIYLSDLSKAEAVCDAALDRLGELRSATPNSRPNQSSYLEHQYQYAILVMVEILYSGGLTEGIKAWRKEVSLEMLRTKNAPFELPRTDANRHSGHQAQQKSLQQAIRDGSFVRALYVLTTSSPGSLKMGLNLPTVMNTPTPTAREKSGRKQRARQESESLYRDDSDTNTIACIEEDEESSLHPDQNVHYMVHAMKSDCHALVSLLIEHWDDITYTNDTLYSPHPLSPGMGIALAFKHDIAGIDDRANKSKALFLAIDFNLPKALPHLLAIGAGKNHIRRMPVSGKSTCYDTDKDCYSCPLGYAVSLGNKSICRLLLNSGALANGPGGKVEPPLHCAIRSKGRPLVPLLIEAGADINLRFKDVRPLALAVFHNGVSFSRDRMVELLLDNGAHARNTSFIGRVWKTPLEQTVGIVEMAGTARLLRRRKETERRGSKGKTDSKNSILSTAWDGVVKPGVRSLGLG